MIVVGASEEIIFNNRKIYSKKKTIFAYAFLEKHDATLRSNLHGCVKIKTLNRNNLKIKFLTSVELIYEIVREHKNNNIIPKLLINVSVKLIEPHLLVGVWVVIIHTSYGKVVIFQSFDSSPTLPVIN